MHYDEPPDLTLWPTLFHFESHLLVFRARGNSLELYNISQSLGISGKIRKIGKKGKVL
jgi:hypothetical protein